MIQKNSKKSLGEISRNVLVLGGVIVAIIIIAVVVVNITNQPVSTPTEEKEGEKTEGPVYEVVMSDIKFKLKEAKDIGNVLKVPEDYPRHMDDLTTTEKFIEVTVTAENIGKENIATSDWDINELVDSEGRIFQSSREANIWIPEESNCGTLLKPGFTPTPCIKIYEVAKVSSGLRVKLSSKQHKKTILSGEEVFYIDLGL